MSKKLVNRVKKLTLGLGYGAKYILFLLADETWDDSNTIMISENKLVEMSEYSLRAVRTHLRELEKQKVVITIVRGDGRGRHSTYQLDLDRAEQLQMLEAIRPVRKPRKTRLEPTEEEPPRSPIPMPPPPTADVAIAPRDAPRPGGDVTINIDDLRESRARIQALIEKAQQGDRYALQWWNSPQGQSAKQRLDTINQLLGLDAHVEREEQPV